MRVFLRAALVASVITFGGAASADDTTMVAPSPPPAPAPEAAPASAVGGDTPAPKHYTSEVDFGGNEPGDKQRLLGGLVGALGFVTTAVGIFEIISSKTRYDEAKSRCGGAPLCQQADIDDASSARKQANIGGWVMLAGVAVLGGGIALYFTAPRVKKQVAVIPGLGNLTLAGSF